MNKTLLVLMWLALLWISPATAQQVLSNGGGSFENGGTTLTFTIGESVAGTFSQSNGTLTQGFNQPVPVLDLGMGPQQGGQQSIQELPVMPYVGIILLMTFLLGIGIKTLSHIQPDYSDHD